MRLRQVLVNLLLNAASHSPAKGQVELRCIPSERCVEVQVLDEGPGIPKEDLSRVFERFYRTDPSRSRDTGGAGLGLAIARQLVEAQGGLIRAENRNGRGAALCFTLPRS